MMTLDWIREKKAFLIDMDGVIYHGKFLLPGVPEFISWLREEGKLYRFHRATGTVHYIPGCCRFGDVSNPNVHADNFDECYTYEEAENILKHRHREAHQCKRCVFPSEKGGK